MFPESPRQESFTLAQQYPVLSFEGRPSLFTFSASSLQLKSINIYVFICGDSPISHLQLQLELLKVPLSTYLRIVNLSPDHQLDICAT